MFFDLKIRWKFLLSSYLVMFFSVLVITFFVISALKTNAAHDIETFRLEEINKVKANLKNYVDMTYGLIDTGYKNSAADVVDRLKRDISAMRYDNGTGYFWINDTGRPYPKMVMHPTAPDLNGKIMDDSKYNCALGQKENLFKAFVDVAEQGGAGFVDYLWTKPTKDGLSAEQPKLSYVRLYKPLNWIIGTGVYIDDIDRTVAAKTAAISTQIRNILINIIMAVAAISLLSFAGLWYLAKKISDPLNACADFSSKLGAGDLNAELDLAVSKDEVGQLATSLMKMRNNLRTSIFHITSVSSSLSDGASDQASSLEETSSSLEEMSAMTRQNAENATMGNKIINESKSIVMQANSAMGRLTAAMKDISQASSETQKIIKTIDEIAFQTNLLALNAAVEAARAGEAGAGFAVVADEVRNLAMRAAEAARVTARLIEDTVKKINDGDELAASTNATFSEVAQNIQKVSQFMNEIVQASDEQAKGIEQINQTVANINNVTQNNVSLGHELIEAVNVFETKDVSDNQRLLGQHRR